MCLSPIPPPSCNLILGSFWHPTGLNPPVWYQKAHFGLEGGLGFQTQPLRSKCFAVNSSKANTPVFTACAKKTPLFRGLCMEQSGSCFWVHPFPPPYSLLFPLCNDIGISLPDIYLQKGSTGPPRLEPCSQVSTPTWSSTLSQRSSKAGRLKYYRNANMADLRELIWSECTLVMFMF